MAGAMVNAFMAVCLAGIGAYLHVNGKDGSGWGFVALILVIVSCSTVT